MKKSFVILLSMITVVSALIAVAGIALAFWLEPNDYKPQLIEWVKSKTGRELVIPGNIALTFFPKLGINTGKLELLDRPEFFNGTFVGINQAKIWIQWLPLLSGNVRMDRVELSGLHLYLRKNDKGNNNWSDFGKSEPATTMPDSGLDKPSASTALVDNAALVAAIAGINVDQAQINWDDRQSGKHFQLDDLHLETGKLAPGVPVDVKLAFLLKPGGTNPIANIHFDTTLTISKHFETFEMDNPLMRYTHGTASDMKLPAIDFKADAIAFNLATQWLTTKGARMDFGDLHAVIGLSGKRLVDAPEIDWAVTVDESNPAAFLRGLNVLLPAMRGKDALTRFSAQLDGSATTDRVIVKQCSGLLDDTSFTGSAAIEPGAEPSMTFDWRLDVVDADRYLPPKTNKSKAVATPAMAVAAAFATFSPETLRALRLNGVLNVARLHFNGLTMQGLRLRISDGHGKISAEQAVNELYHGSYHGKTEWAVGEDVPALSAQERIDGVRLEPLLKGWSGKAGITGTLNASAKWQGQGRNLEALKSSLSGQTNFLLKDGAVHGFGLQAIVDSLASPGKPGSSISANEANQTSFTEMSGNATLNNGIIWVRKLVARSQSFRVDGQGSADLKNEALDGKLIAKMVKKPATATEPEQLHSTPVVIKVAGCFDKPEYALDVEALLTDKNKAKIQKFIDKNQHKIDKLLDKLDKKLGPGAGELLKDLL